LILFDLYFISDSWDRTRDLWNIRLVHWPVDHRGGRAVVVVITTDVTISVTSCFLLEKPYATHVLACMADSVFCWSDE
jgi:hypothetical protein